MALIDGINLVNSEADQSRPLHYLGVVPVERVIPLFVLGHDENGTRSDIRWPSYQIFVCEVRRQVYETWSGKIKCRRTYKP